MNLRIMITGKNRKIASDLYEHINAETPHTARKCSPEKSSVFDMLTNDLPHVMIICTGYENYESVKVFDTVLETRAAGFTEVIVVANDDDRSTFLNYSGLNRLFFLSRPVSSSALYNKLSELEEYFELHKPEEPEPVKKTENERRRSRPPKRHVLVVDDDPEQLAQIKAHLREFYDVTLINSGRNVLKALSKRKADLILLDFIMPDMDGPEVLTQLKNTPEYSDIPVVFLTGVKEKETVTKTILELKPQGYVLKPSKKSELVAKIIDILG